MKGMMDWNRRKKYLYVVSTTHCANAYTYPTVYRQHISPSHARIDEVAHTFPCPLKEEPHNKYLQSCHRNHQRTLHHTEIEYSTLRALDGTHVPVLSRPEILLISIDGGKVAGDFEDGFFEGRGLFRRGTLFAGKLGVFGFVLDLDPSTWCQ